MGVHVMGVAEALAKHADNEKVETKGVKAHFHLDESGLLNITSIESMFERTISVEEQEEEERKKEEDEKAKSGEDDSWNLGDTISNFFNKESGSEENKSEEDGDKTEEENKDKEPKADEKEGSKDEKAKKE